MKFPVRITLNKEGILPDNQRKISKCRCGNLVWRMVVLTGMLAWLAVPDYAHAALERHEDVSTNGIDGVSSNEDVKVEMDMYVEYMPKNSSPSALFMSVEFDEIKQGNGSSWKHRDESSEAALINNAEVFKTYWDIGGSVSAKIPVASATPQDNHSQSRSPIYRIQDRAINKIYSTPKFLSDNVENYKLHYRLPEGYELYSRPLGSRDYFRPGSTLESAKFEVAAYETVVISKSAPGALPGKATSINSSNGQMRFSLGFLTNGKSAGFLDFMHDLQYYPISGERIEVEGHRFTVSVVGPRFGEPPGATDLHAISFGDEVKILAQKNLKGFLRGVSPIFTGVRQVCAPQCIVDVSKDGFDLLVRFFEPNQKGGKIMEEKDPYSLGTIKYDETEAPFDMSGKTPFVTYRISFEHDITSAYVDGCDVYTIGMKYVIKREEDGQRAQSDILYQDSIPFIKYEIEFHNCNECDGTGDYDCPYCEGPSEEECAVCGGITFIDCQLCEGAGGKKCGSCGGTGKKKKGEEDPKKCEQCDGDGTIDCKLCNGSGAVDCPCTVMQCHFCRDEGVLDSCARCYGNGSIPYLIDGHIPDDEYVPNLVRNHLNVNGFDTSFTASSVIIGYKDFLYGGLTPRYYSDSGSMHSETYFSGAYKNAKFTTSNVNNGSTNSVRHYTYFSAFNRFYMMRATRGQNGKPDFDFFQRTSVLSSITEGDQELKTEFGYYNLYPLDARHDTHHGRIKWRTNTDGSWAMYDYSSDIASLGRLTKVVTPWLSQAQPVELPTSTAAAGYCITTYTYAIDWEGVKRLPETVVQTANGQTVGKTINSYAGAIANGAPIWITTSASWASENGAQLMTTSKVFEGLNCPSWLKGLPYSSEAPDGSKETVAYHRGTVTAHGAFSANPAGRGFRSVVLKGVSATASTGTLLSSYEGVDIDPIRMIPNVSTAEVTIRDEYAHTLKTETLVYTGVGAWETIDSASMRYDTVGNLVYREKLNGMVYTAAYQGGRKQSETDEQGMTTKFTYDLRGRVSSTTRDLPAPLSSLTTTFTYDNENRVLSTTVIGGTDSIASTKTYDSTGRVLTETTEGMTTTYAYAVETGVITKTTVTLPDGATRIIENHRDGRPKSITGTAGPEEHYTYNVANGSVTTIKYIGASGAGSPRYVKTSTDWLGRTTSQQWPAAAGSGEVTQTNTYNTKGQLASSQTGSLAPTLYFYDDNAVMNQHGLAISRSSTLGDADRKHTFTYGYVSLNNALWNYSETCAYPDNSTTGVVQTKTWTRVTGLGAEGSAGYGALIAESIAEDAKGNRATIKSYLNRSSGKTTTVTLTPFTTEPSVTESIDGKIISQTSAAGVITHYTYDHLRRPIRSIDRTSAGKTHNNITYELGTTRISTITDNLGVTQHTYTYDEAGRLVADATPRIDPSTNQVSGINTSHFEYDIRGQLLRVWGDVPYPVRYEYNDYGQRTAQYTFRNDGSDASGGGDKTTFNYHPGTGVLLSRTDAKDQSTSYTYTSLGQLSTRTWARGVQTTYTNDTATGALINAAYSDGTPSLSYAHDRLGRIQTITDATGTRIYTYRDSGDNTDLKPDQEQLGSLYGNRTLANQYETSTRRLTGLKVKSGSGVSPLIEHSLAYTYDPVNARLRTISSNAGTYTYAYLANSNLISSVTSSSYTVTRQYENNRNLLSDLQTRAGSDMLTAAYAYTHDALGRRIRVVQAGQLYVPYITGTKTMVTAYGYNNRNELTTAQTTVGNDTTRNPIPGRTYGYTFDPIGNRIEEKIDGTGHSYTANELNQYTKRDTPWWLPITGIASRPNELSLRINKNGLNTSNWTNNYFHSAFTKTTPSAATLETITIQGTAPGQPVQTETRKTPARPTTETFLYDEDGNLTQDSLWRYEYDGENRLKGMYSKTADATGSPVAARFVYDYMGRRVLKETHTHNGSWATPTLHAHRATTVYLYQGWTLLAEYSAGSVGILPAGSSIPSTSTLTLNLIRRYTWGVDLSGTLGGAGDIGGLLAIEDLRTAYAGVFHPAYDGNGNMMALTETSLGNTVAAYEYDPFGNVLRASGTYAKENPIRFSGKYHDNETGLSYHGFRYYSASLGRFVNRDPLEERGGWNLYSGLNYTAGNPYAGASGVEGTSWATEWEQAQDRLLRNTSLPHTTQSVTFDGKKNSGLPGASENNQKTYTANATGHYSQGGAPGKGPQAPSMSGGNPAKGNIDTNLYIYAGNNPINGFDAMGLDAAMLDALAFGTEEDIAWVASEIHYANVRRSGYFPTGEEMMNDPRLMQEYSTGQFIETVDMGTSLMGGPRTAMEGGYAIENGDYLTGIGLLGLGMVEMAPGVGKGGTAVKAGTKMGILGRMGSVLKNTIQGIKTLFTGNKTAAVRTAKTVLGKFPDYITMADNLNANRFSIAPKVWEKMSKAEQWAANLKYLDEMIARGDEIILSNPVKNINDVSGFFRKELDYLINQGFRISEDGTRMLR